MYLPRHFQFQYRFVKGPNQFSVYIAPVRCQRIIILYIIDALRIEDFVSLTAKCLITRENWLGTQANCYCIEVGQPANRAEHAVVILLLELEHDCINNQ